MNQIVKALKEQEAYAAGNGLWKLEELYKMAALEIEVKAARIAELTADAKLNDMAWTDNLAALRKQAEDIRTLKQALTETLAALRAWQAIHPEDWDSGDRYSVAMAEKALAGDQ